MKEMKRSNNTIFKYTMILGAAMSLSACNGLFENIYDAPTETEMEIKENSFSQIKTVEYTEWAYIDFSGRKVTQGYYQVLHGFSASSRLLPLL